MLRRVGLGFGILSRNYRVAPFINQYLDNIMSNKKFKASPPNIARLKLEAIFHPKFENETPDSDIRKQMLTKVSSCEGYIEASLKHSGSLILWSGRQCFYSKNSTANIFTKVGEIMLMQHFARCFDDNWKEEYDRCSEFVYKQRLTCSFEVVTSILGHHGDLPKRDYLILIAVADRGCGRGRFYSTNELVRFAHKFRLPHNDAWIFPSSAACEELFHSYDKMKETGTATKVIKQLDQIVLKNEGVGCAKVASLYPHDIFQGEILEGIVFRYVPYNITATEDGDDANSTMQNSSNEMKELCAASHELLRLVPPSKMMDEHDNDAIQRTDLRALAAMDDFEQEVENVLRNFHGPNIRQIQPWSDNSDAIQISTKCLNVVNVANEILSSTHTNNYDRETLDIAQLIQILDQLHIHASYKVLIERGLVGTEARHLCILHIHNDSSFPKYNAFLRREGRIGGMMLFRGFTIELVPTEDDFCSDGNKTESVNLVAASTSDTESNTDDEEKLMLKMKFLPYMVRTFICRNGLSILQSSGQGAFTDYALGQLTKWQVSDASVRKWVPFFRGWARYCSSPSDKLPPLTERTYLHHYNEYSELFDNGEYQSSPTDESLLSGLLVVVGPSKNNLEALSLSLSKQLKCSNIFHDVNNITDKDILLSMQGGLICTAGIEDGYGNLRKLAKKFHEAIHIVMVEGNLEETLDTDNAGGRKLKGMTKGWRQSKCKMLLDLPQQAAALTNVDAALQYLCNDPTAKSILEELLKSCGKRDERPGLVVYFPSIPGSGKSSLCQYITADTLGVADDRHLIVLEGDQVRKQNGKFYSVVEMEVLSKPASVAILDKNVPPTAFPSIHKICLESKSIALPVLPSCMQDTLVGDGALSCVYPFPLQYLAACMSRVLRRDPNSHKGKLDSATDTACMVVTKFYCFYRNMTAAVLKERLESIGYQGKEVIIPFFREAVLPLPADLKIALEDAIVLQTRDDMNESIVGDKDMIEIEKRLRTAINDNQIYIDNLTVPLEESKTVLLSEMSKAISSLPEKLEARSTTDEPAAGTIKIASVDLDYEVVHAEIEKLRKSYPEVDRYMSEREKHKNNDENDTSQDRFITSVHCTFAHASQVTQSDMIATFQHLLGSAVEVKAISILFSDKIAAIELEVPLEPSFPRPKNEFPHITLWCAKDTEAYESNALPEKVKCNEAKRVVFDQSIMMKGVFSFWHY